MKIRKLQKEFRDFPEAPWNEPAPQQAIRILQEHRRRQRRRRYTALVLAGLPFLILALAMGSAWLALKLQW